MDTILHHKGHLKPCPKCEKKAIICMPLEEITGWGIRCIDWDCYEIGGEIEKTSLNDLNDLIKQWNKKELIP